MVRQVHITFLYPISKECWTYSHLTVAIKKVGAKPSVWMRFSLNITFLKQVMQ